MIRGKRRWAAWAAVAALACLRLAHVHLLWADEDYHLAAAINLLHGKVPYRDFWYDKPPLSALYYLLIGGHGGWLLRLLDAAYVLAACSLAYRIAAHWWSEAEGLWAAFLLAFYLAFDFPSAVIPFAVDALMLVPHLAAIHCAQKRRPVIAGIWTGVAFLANPKAVFVLATCAAWLTADIGWLAAGFLLPLLAGGLWASGLGAWAGYNEQVWHWGLLYARKSPISHPWRTGSAKMLEWMGFHAVIVIGAARGFIDLLRRDRVRLGLWLVFCLAGTALGSRFAPRYFLLLLPPVTIAASRGLVLGIKRFGRRAAILASLLLLIPVIRFGPHYVQLMAADFKEQSPKWSDAALDLDSQQVAAKLAALSQKGNTLLVWGYRPDIYVYTRMASDSRFWDSQPLTGVPADRHLSGAIPIDASEAAIRRRELTRSHPTFLVDGLGLLNPRLAPGMYPDLQGWLAHYELVDRTRLSLIYKRR